MLLTATILIRSADLQFAFAHNADAIRLAHIVSGSWIYESKSDPFEATASLTTNPFWDLANSQILASKGRWKEAGSYCDLAEQKFGRGAVAQYVTNLCDAWSAAGNGDWERSVRGLAAAQVQNPYLTRFLVQQYPLVLGQQALDQWTETGEDKHLCTAIKYLGTEVVKDGVASTENCRHDMRLLSGPLIAGSHVGCLSVNTDELDTPGILSVWMSETGCDAAEYGWDLPQVNTLKIATKIGNGGMFLPAIGLPASGVSPYYLDDTRYEIPSVIREDVSGRKYLAVAPKRDNRPDTLVIEILPVTQEKTYLVGGVGRGSINLGCTWWGGAADGVIDAVNIVGADWTLAGTVLRPPHGAQHCVVTVYNALLDKVSDLDAVFFAELNDASLAERTRHFE